MRILIICIVMLFSAFTISAQTISGSIRMAGFTNGTTMKSITPVQLFKQFKDNKITLGFSFKTGTANVVLFDMKTSLKHKGVVIGSTIRPGWPWLPGDMFLPAEAFDFIPMLQKLLPRGTTTANYLPAGEYEIVMQMIPSAGQDVKGSITPATIKFIAQ